MLQVLKGGPQFIQDDDMLGGSFYTPEVALTLKTEHLFFLFLICEMGKKLVPAAKVPSMSGVSEIHSTIARSTGLPPSSIHHHNHAGILETHEILHLPIRDNDLKHQQKARVTK